MIIIMINKLISSKPKIFHWFYILKCACRFAVFYASFNQYKKKFFVFALAFEKIYYLEIIHTDVWSGCEYCVNASAFTNYTILYIIRQSTSIKNLKYIKSEAFREYSHLQHYNSSKKIFQKTLFYNQIKKGLKIYYTTTLRHV